MIFSNDSCTIFACTSSPQVHCWDTYYSASTEKLSVETDYDVLFSFARLTTLSSLSPGLTLVVIHPRSLRYSSRPNCCSSRRTGGLCILSGLSLLDRVGLLRNLTGGSVP